MIWEAAAGALAGIGQAVGTVIGTFKQSQNTRAALRIQRDLGKQQIALAEEQTKIVAEQADKDRETQSLLTNKMLKLWQQDRNAEREADALKTAFEAPLDGGGGGGSGLLLIGGGLLLLLLLKKK